MHGARARRPSGADDTTPSPSPAGPPAALAAAAPDTRRCRGPRVRQPVPYLGSPEASPEEAQQRHGAPGAGTDPLERGAGSPPRHPHGRCRGAGAGRRQRCGGGGSAIQTLHRYAVGCEQAWPAIEIPRRLRVLNSSRLCFLPQMQPRSVPSSGTGTGDRSAPSSRNGSFAVKGTCRTLETQTPDGLGFHSGPCSSSPAAVTDTLAMPSPPRDKPYPRGHVVVPRCPHHNLLHAPAQPAPPQAVAALANLQRHPSGGKHRAPSHQVWPGRSLQLCSQLLISLRKHLCKLSVCSQEGP